MNHWAAILTPWLASGLRRNLNAFWACLHITAMAAHPGSGLRRHLLTHVATAAQPRSHWESQTQWTMNYLVKWESLCKFMVLINPKTMNLHFLHSCPPRDQYCLFRVAVALLVLRQRSLILLTTQSFTLEVPGIEAGTFYMTGKCSTTKSWPHP